jgi:putative transposase
MGLKNKTYPELTYFLTMTVVDWVDVFTRPVYRNIIVDSLNYCIREKNLEVFGWVLMSNHLHLIARTKNNVLLSDVLRDFKKFTSKKIVAAIEQEKESRKEWMLDGFWFAGKYNPKIKDYTFWQPGNEPKEIFSSEFFDQKLDYIHNNSVREGRVEEPQHFLCSSARDYAGIKGLVEITLA